VHKLNLRQAVKRLPTLEIISIIAALLIWQAIFLALPQQLQESFPDPVSVVSEFWRLCTVGDINKNTLLIHSIVSFSRLIVGFAIAVLTGFPLGLLMSLRASVYRIFKPLVEILRPIPPIAWIPLAIVLFKVTYGPLFIIWLGAFFPILLNTIAGVKRTSSILVDVAKTFGAEEKQTAFKVIIPSALPEVFTGLRIGLGVGWMSIIGAEMIGASSPFGQGPQGLGYLIFNYWMSGLIAPVVAGMIAIGLIAYVMNEIFLQTEKHLFKWRKEVTV